jgi:hypothetical protein
MVCMPIDDHGHGYISLFAIRLFSNTADDSDESSEGG